MELQDLERKAKEAKEKRQAEFREMFEVLEQNLTKSLNTRLKQIENDIAKIKLHIEAIEEEIEIEVKILRHKRTKELFYQVYDLKEGLFEKMKNKIKGE